MKTPTLTYLRRIKKSSPFPTMGLEEMPTNWQWMPPSLHRVQVVSVIYRLPSNPKWTQPKILSILMGIGLAHFCIPLQNQISLFAIPSFGIHFFLYHSGVLS